MVARATWTAGADWDRLSWVSAWRSASVSGRRGSFLRRDIDGLPGSWGHRLYHRKEIMATGKTNDPLAEPLGARLGSRCASRREHLHPHLGFGPDPLSCRPPSPEWRIGLRP